MPGWVGVFATSREAGTSGRFTVLPQSDHEPVFSRNRAWSVIEKMYFQHYLKPPSHSVVSKRPMTAYCAAIYLSGLTSRQVAGEGVLVEQDFDEVDRAGEIGMGKQGVKLGLGFNAVMVYTE